MGNQIHAYVQTDIGLRLHLHGRDVYTFVDGAAERVGPDGRRKDQRELVADGPRVAGSTSRTGVTMLDVGSGEARTRHVEEIGGRGRCARVTALDGDLRTCRRPRCGDLGLRDGRGDGAGHRLSPGGGCRGGPPVSRRERGMTAQGAIVSPSGSVPVPLDDFGNLSPDGSYVTAEYYDEGFLRMPTPAPNAALEHGARLGRSATSGWMTTHSPRWPSTRTTPDSGYGRPSLLTCSAVTGDCTTTVAALPHGSGSSAADRDRDRDLSLSVRG